MGKSSNSLEYATSDKILNILKSFVDKIIGKEKFLLVGQSFGGYLAQGLLAHYKFQVDGLCLLCPVVIPDSIKRTLPEQYLSFSDKDYLNKLSPQQAELISKNLIVANEKTIKRQQKEVLSGLIKADQKFLETLQKNYDLTIDADKMIANMSYDKPSLIMVGHQDTRVGYKDQWELFNILPRASFAVPDVADHSLQIEEPNVFTALVENWLERMIKFN